MNDYENTCLGWYYDTGEDAIYKLNVTTPTFVAVELNPYDTTFTGIAVTDACPSPVGCNWKSIAAVATIHHLYMSLEVGTYYVQIDIGLNSGGTCLPRFDFTITSCTQSGACCTGDGSCVELNPEDCALTYGIYMGDGTVCDPNPCQVATPGDSCLVPLPIEYTDLPFSDLGQSTSGHYNFYSDTCMGMYDDGHEMIYELTLDTSACVEIIFTPRTKWTGVTLDDSCPPDTTSCIALSTERENRIHGIECTCLDAGIYYIMVDRAFAGVSNFDLVINECNAPLGACCVAGVCTAVSTEKECAAMSGTWFEGYGCEDFDCPEAAGDACLYPVSVQVPGDTPFADLHQSTCGRNDDYHSSCLINFDNGEDILYKITVTTESFVSFTLDPHDTCLTGMTIDDNCPPDNDCLASSTSYNALIHSIPCMPLDAGEYYLMIDTWPPAGCIPDFDLMVDVCPFSGICCAHGDCFDDVPYRDCLTLNSSAFYADQNCTHFSCELNGGEYPQTAIQILKTPYSSVFDNHWYDSFGPIGSCDKHSKVPPMHNDAWFEWSPATDCVATVRVDENTYDAIMVVRDGSLNELYCADNGIGGDPEQIAFYAHADTEYLFQIGISSSYQWPDGSDTLFSLTCEDRTQGACCLASGECFECDNTDCTAAGGVFLGKDTTCFSCSCPERPAGDTCELPVDISLPGDLPFTDVAQTTCGRGRNYFTSCLSQYSWGEDIVYRLNVNQCCCIKIQLDVPQSQGLGLAVDDECPPSSPCLASETTSTSQLCLEYLELDRGTYYLIIDGAMDHRCIDSFYLTIQAGNPINRACCIRGECVANVTAMECRDMGGLWFESGSCPEFSCPDWRGGDCSDPISMMIPEDIPYQDQNQTTCGRSDNYQDTCLELYDDNEEVIYELLVTKAACVDITLLTTDLPIGGIVAMALDRECPPGLSCLAYTQASSSEYGARLTNLNLSPGFYYIMVDTRFPVYCLDMFMLTVEECRERPANDECFNACKIQSTYPPVVTGSTSNATKDCQDVLDLRAVWYHFDVIHHINKVTIDYCTTEDPIFTVGTILYPAPDDPAVACPSDCSDWILCDMVNWHPCPNSIQQPAVSWTIPGPATYYLPVKTNDSTGLGMDFSFTVSVEDESIPNDDCIRAMPIGEVSDLAIDTWDATEDNFGTCVLGPNLWYCFTAPRSGLAVASLSNADDALTIAAYDTCRCFPLGFELDCSGVVRETHSAIVSFDIVQNEPYLIEVGGTGRGRLDITYPPPIPSLTCVGILSLLGTLGWLMTRKLRRGK
ncbi:hypothetical protein JW905_11255 [bacterium]|nr:hypothetical protein [candidate division CSSED10-310 bacterium]